VDSYDENLTLVERLRVNPLPPFRRELLDGLKFLYEHVEDIKNDWRAEKIESLWNWWAEKRFFTDGQWDLVVTLVDSEGDGEFDGDSF
jgi:hypothetical protein